MAVARSPGNVYDARLGVQFEVDLYGGTGRCTGQFMVGRTNANHVLVLQHRDAAPVTLAVD